MPEWNSIIRTEGLIRKRRLAEAWKREESRLLALAQSAAPRMYARLLEGIRTEAQHIGWAETMRQEKRDPASIQTSLTLSRAPEDEALILSLELKPAQAIIRCRTELRRTADRLDGSALTSTLAVIHVVYAGADNYVLALNGKKVTVEEASLILLDPLRRKS
jgi:hypothetical protein